MKYQISPDRKTLTILATPHDRNMLTLAEDVHSDKAMAEFLEPLTCNSELEWINPADTGDLTDAPMLGILGEEIPFTKEMTGSWAVSTGPNLIQPILERWAFMDHQVRSVLEDLRDTGKAVFIS